MSLKTLFAILQLCSCFIGFLGYIRMIKASKTYQKACKEAKNREELLNLIKDFPRVLKAGKSLFIGGIIAASVFGIISVLL